MVAHGRLALKWAVGLHTETDEPSDEDVDDDQNPETSQQYRLALK